MLDTTLDLQAEDDYIGKLETVTRKLDLAQQKSSLLRDEFNQLSNTTYSSAGEANELANRMKSVADSIAENGKNIIEYGKSITEYYMSAMSAIGSMADNTIERATSLFERNIKTLQEGGLTGLQFNLSPTVPQSAYEKQRQENLNMEDEMRSYYDTLAQMQKTALDMQYKETVADNERKRQELIESLNEAMSEQEGYSQSSIGLQKITNATTSAEQKRDNQEKTAEEQTFSNIVEGIIVDTNNWMVNNPIKSPGLDKTSWEVMVNEAEGYANKVINAFNRASSFSAGTNSGITTKSSETTTKASGTGKIVDTAAQYLGVPYVWGGTSPSGFDCSGFVQYVCKQNGISIKRVADDQLHYSGTSVSKSQLQPGDLVFFGSGDYATHVGMYVGDGMMIHAPSTGKNIMYTSIESDYYSSRYIGARRVY